MKGSRIKLTAAPTDDDNTLSVDRIKEKLFGSENR